MKATEIQTIPTKTWAEKVNSWTAADFAVADAVAEPLVLEEGLGGGIALPLTPIKLGKTPFPPGPV